MPQHYRHRRLPVVGQAPKQHPHSSSDASLRVALVYPRLSEATYKTKLQDRESLALGYLTASLEKHGYPVQAINAEALDLDTPAVIEALCAHNPPGLIGISAGSQRAYVHAKAIAVGVKSVHPHLHITLGGIFPTAACVQILEDCRAIDSVVRGEGEEAIVELAERISTGRSLATMLGITYRESGDEIVENPARPRIKDLDALGFPARRDLEHAISNGSPVRFAKIIASRGCYARCSFCSIHQIYGDHLVMRRTPAHVVSEIADLQRRYGVERVAFQDDLFITPSARGKAWVRDFCSEIDRQAVSVRFWMETRADTVELELMQALVRAGLKQLFIGIEAGVESVLVRWDKGVSVEQNAAALQTLKGVVGLRSEDVYLGYIMFDPEMTFDELLGQYRWIRDSGHCRVQNLQNKMNVYWGTPQYARMIAQGRRDGGPLGERWPYTFDDARVGAFESAMRRFHARIQAEHSANLIAVKQAYIKRRYALHSDAHPEIADLLSQALRRLEQMERSCWYFMFDRYLEVLVNGDLAPETEEAVWLDLQPVFAAIRRESALLLHSVAVLEDLQFVDRTTPAHLLVPAAWRDEEYLYLRPDPQSIMGYAARPFARGDDLYDHDCQVVHFGDSGTLTDRGEPARPGSLKTVAASVLPLQERCGPPRGVA